MTVTAVHTKTELRRQREAHAQRYAPRRPAAVQPARVQTHEDPQLRRILVQTLDALRRPDVVPSEIIYGALKQAQASR